VSAPVERVAVVGAGLAGATAVETLRAEGFEGDVVLVGGEQHLPYERPPLSKGYLWGTEPLEKAFVHEAAWYDDHRVELRLGTVVTGIDLDSHTLDLGGDALGYDRLLLTTGAAARRLPPADDSGAPTTYLRTIEDSKRLRTALQPGSRVLIVGGGWIGLEVAAAARTAGCEVVVLEVLELPLVRMLGREVAEVFASLHVSHGVDLRTNTRIASVEHRSGEVVVTLGDGSTVRADLLVVGVGATPSTALAEAAGLRTDDGVVVDEQLRTSHPDVLAAGDVANAFHPVLRRHVRVEHWDNAVEQARTAARNLLGAQQPYGRLPYFFTDQYDVGMEYVGSIGPEGYDEVVIRGDVPGRVFGVLWLKESTVVAGMHVNDWDAMDPIRRIVSGERVDVARLPDADVPLAELID
jgi:3-phenylpropionate/trans-cinnamate dioxygenase ferredoxin reductase subunit